MEKKELAYVQKEFTKGSRAVLKYRAALKGVCEHLEYLCMALREQASGNPDKISMWNSSSTVNVLIAAQKLLK